MTKIFWILIICLFVSNLNAQENCNLYEGDCKKACEISIEASKFQGSRSSQLLFDSCIALCPTFASAYYEKSVPFLKHGLITQWKELIDKAVELKPKSFLLNRGCNQIQFFRNYANGLKDLNRLYQLTGHFNIGYTNSGEYHVQMIRAIAYRKVGNILKSIEIMQALLNSDWYSIGLYDFHHLGVSYLEAGQLNEAKQAFTKQLNENELAETYYYIALILEKEDQFEQAQEMLSKAEVNYKNGSTMNNNYYHFLDKVFYSEIQTATKRLIQR